jgi:beta-lactamase superfamily II metal-dependent hydrolase
MTAAGASTSICSIVTEREAMAINASATICMYRLHELGDCFLVTFKAGDTTSRMLIDCGSFRNSEISIAKLTRISKHLIKDLDGAPLDVVVGTHQHNDHLSGFVHCETAFRDAIKIGQVWLSWLDDPRDRKARRIGEAHNNLMMNLTRARDSLHGLVKSRGALRSASASSLEVLNDMLGFHGANAAGMVPEVPAKAMRILKELGEREARYLRPGQTLEMPGLPEGTVRVHVLGPPRKDELLYRKEPRKGESYDHALASAGLLAAKFLEASNRHRGDTSSEEEHYPFNTTYKRRKSNRNGSESALQRIIRRYDNQREAWRRIDDDWMEQAGALALFLDTFTNNSSLVLAIELVGSGKVLLFAADAQTGNWLSWKDIKWQRNDVSTDDLLERTVFYKVGHHASHNATLVDAFEKMGHADLVALIPVHKEDPNIKKKNGWKMPATNLFKRLVQKTSNRVLQMDGVNPPHCDPDQAPAKASWAKVGIRPKITKDSIVIEISG